MPRGAGEDIGPWSREGTEFLEDGNRVAGEPCSRHGGREGDVEAGVWVEGHVVIVRGIADIYRVSRRINNSRTADPDAATLLDAI